MPTILQRNHICNCDFCERKSKCLICGTKSHLHRAHIIPRAIIQEIREEDFEKYEWLSFDGDNVFILCEAHHRQYDNFTLSEQGIVFPFIDEKLKKFIEFTNDKTVTKKGLDKLNRWIYKTNEWLFGGIKVLDFKYEQII